jgi:FAD/FMN-containing dehydrogenase
MKMPFEEEPMAASKRDLQTLQKQLSKIVGSEWVTREGTYLVVYPGTNDEIAQILKLANRTKRPVVPLGGGTGWWSIKRPSPGGILIRMTRMNEILMVDEDAMTVTAQAGITYQRLEEEIGRKGFRLVISPESGKVATLGGHIETWGTSPHSSAFYEDQSTQIVALKVVLPTGEIVQTGSSAVTTAGGSFARRFFPSDLTGLFIGAESAFGIVTEATLKLHRWPETILTRMVEYRDLRPAVATLRKIQEEQRKGSLSTLLEQRVMQEGTFRLAVPRLADSLARSTRYVICFRGEGEIGEVESHMAKTCGMAQTEGGRVLDDPVPEWWEGRHGLFPELVLSKGPRIMLVAITPMGKYEEACELAERFGHEHSMDISLIGYPLGGPVMLTHVVIRFEGATAQARERTLSLARKLMEGLMELGCVPHRVGTDFLPVLIKKLDPSYYGLVKRIKKLLDPKGIMRPGVVVPVSSEKSDRRK